MKSRVLAVAALATAGLLVASSSWAGPPPTLVEVFDDEFDPRKASQILESSTTWDWSDTVNRRHNVREDSKLFYSGQPSDDIGTQFTRLISAGTFHYYCEKHGSRAGGMDGVLKVAPALDSSQTDDLIDIRWAPSLPQTGDQFDVRWKQSGVPGGYETWLKDTSLTDSVFGEGDEPIDVEPGRTYKFQARSERSADPKQRSGWSPAFTVTADE